jgi:hypothetical protein
MAVGATISVPEPLDQSVHQGERWVKHWTSSPGFALPAYHIPLYMGQMIKTRLLKYTL